jgi:hypothetical protein
MLHDHQIAAAEIAPADQRESRILSIPPSLISPSSAAVSHWSSEFRHDLNCPTVAAAEWPALAIEAAENLYEWSHRLLKSWKRKPESAEAEDWPALASHLFPLRFRVQRELDPVPAPAAQPVKFSAAATATAAAAAPATTTPQPVPRTRKLSFSQLDSFAVV